MKTTAIKLTRLLRVMTATVALVCAAMLTLCACGKGAQTLPNEKMRLYFLDVGQGDCTLIRTAAGDILIDAGPEASQERLCLRLHQLGVERLRLMVLTHYDEDHIGGADGVLRQFSVDEVWGGEAADDNESLRALRAALGGRGMSITPARQKDQRVLGDVRITALAPLQVPVPEGNEGSLVLQVVCDEITALFTGDVDAATEKLLVATYPGRLSAQIYQVGHHGSNTSTSQALVDAMRPSYAVISSGVGNEYGHPNGAVIERLEAAGATVLRTDLSGELLFITDGKILIPPSGGS